MASMITSEFIFNSINEHLENRRDLWHVVNGPKRETWFTAESIAALSHSGPNTQSEGYRVYGEESYSSLAKIMMEFDSTFEFDLTQDGVGRFPDISVFENLVNEKIPEISIMEAKLISPESTKNDTDYSDFETEIEQCLRGIAECSDGENSTKTKKRAKEEDFSGLIPKNNLNSQLNTLGQTDNSDGLLDQLERARRLFPEANVFGLIFIVSRTCSLGEEGISNFCSNLKSKVDEIYNASQWSLWSSGFMFFDSQKDIEALWGKDNNVVSIGLGIIERTEIER